MEKSTEFELDEFVLPPYVTFHEEPWGNPDSMKSVLTARSVVVLESVEVEEVVFIELEVLELDVEELDVEIVELLKCSV